MKAIINILAAGLLVVGMPCLAFEGETEASVSVSGTNARTSADLGTGIKEVYCDVAVYYRMGTSSAVATTNDAFRVASTRWYVNITNDGRRLAFITSGGTGTCRIYPVNFLAASRMAGMLIASLPIPSTLTLSGDITADHFHSTAAGTENGYNMPQDVHLVFNDPTNTVYMDYNGTVLEVVGATLSVTKVTTPAFACSDTRACGSKTLSGSAGTVSVYSGSKCICSMDTPDDTAATISQCSVSSTTLSISENSVGVGNAVVNYFCWTAS